MECLCVGIPFLLVNKTRVSILKILRSHCEFNEQSNDKC